MRGRVGVAVALFVTGVLASLLVSRGSADTTPTSSTDTTQLTTPVSTSATTTAPPSPTTTAPTTTSATIVTAPTSVPANVSRPVAGHRRRCSVVGGVELLLPRRRPLVLRPVAQEPAGRRVHERRLVYPVGGSLVAIGSLTLDARRCSGAVVIRSLSLFRGVITAAMVKISVRRGGSTASVIRGLRVNGRPVASRGRPIRLGHWGSLALRQQHGALVIRLLKPRAGLPAGTIVVVAFAAARLPTSAARRVAFHHAATSMRRKRHPRTRARGPLKVTPPLGLRRYVCPVVGAATFGDSYGAFRADVSGNWHHGDDIFAPVGTPAVAVASGTLNRVGWEAIGGWRLWLRDRRGNEFYYAHLSGYSPLTLRSKRVRAGQVVGFVGNTGDAFTTPPHLHFEIHPHQLLALHYDGAVDPTTYLDHWRHLDRVRVPRPTLAAVPRGDVGREARFVFRELLAARGLAPPAPTSPPKVRLTGLDRPLQSLEAATARRSASAGAMSPVPLALISTTAAFVLSSLAALFAGRRRSRR